MLMGLMEAEDTGSEGALYDGSSVLPVDQSARC